MADTSKPPKGLLITGIVLLVLSVGSCGFGGFSAASFAGDLADIVDGTRSTPLGTPTQMVGAGEVAVILTSTDASCEVRDSAGNDVTLSDPATGTTGTVETTDGASLDFAYSFETDSNETYDVICGDELSGGTGEYIAVPFPGLGKIAGFLGGIGAGFVLFVLGVIFLIIGLVKRSKWKKNNTGGSYGGPPPGGYTPPAPGQPQGGYAPPPGSGYTPPPPGQTPAPMPPPPVQPPPPMPPGPPPGNTPPPPGNTPPPPGNTPPPFGN